MLPFCLVVGQQLKSRHGALEHLNEKNGSNTDTLQKAFNESVVTIRITLHSFFIIKNILALATVRECETRTGVFSSGTDTSSTSPHRGKSLHKISR